MGVQLAGIARVFSRRVSRRLHRLLPTLLLLLLFLLLLLLLPCLPLRQELVRQLICSKDGSIHKEGTAQCGGEASKEHPTSLGSVALPGTVQPACKELHGSRSMPPVSRNQRCRDSKRLSQHCYPRMQLAALAFLQQLGMPPALPPWYGD